MASLKRISKTGVETGQTIEALQVSQSFDAFNPTSTVGYDIGISGSLQVCVLERFPPPIDIRHAVFLPGYCVL